MNKAWIKIFRKLFVSNSKEFLRDPLPLTFAMVMPVVFLIIFGITGIYVQKSGMANNETASSPAANYFLFLMPALMSLGLLNISLFSTAVQLVYAKEKGILRQYILIPIPISSLLAAQVAVRLIYAVVQGGILLTTATFIFNVPIIGNLFELVSVFVICAIVMIICGYALAGLVNSVSMGLVLFMILNFYTLAFGQIFIDMRNVPFAKWLIYTTPVSSVSDLLRQICLGRWGNLSINSNLAILCSWGLLAYVVGTRNFKFLPTR